MNIIKGFVICVLIFTSIYAQSKSSFTLQEIRARDPFILADKHAKTYYLYVSMSNQLGYEQKETGVVVYKSKDLKRWFGPKTVFKTGDNSWGKKALWAPEVHLFNNKYYLFATLTSKDTLPRLNGRPKLLKRGTEIFIADSPEGPFKTFENKQMTPENWMALDGTLWIENGTPWMVFCHEWIQTTDGTIELVKLSSDLSKTLDGPKTLFKASDASWVQNLKNINVSYDQKVWDGYVTDGPYLYKAESGKLLMIWSSFGLNKYAIGIAESKSGKIEGPWEQLKEPLFKTNGGHGMIFKAFNGKLMLAFHQPNDGPDERTQLYELEDTGDMLKLKKDKPGTPLKAKTVVAIKKDEFFINDEITYKGRYWNGYKVEGLLMNSRMVQGIFDDLNPSTADEWKYPDTHSWSAERNTDEFVASMEDWYKNGLLAVTLNLQGGSPLGYGNKGWYNSAFTENGELRQDYMARLEKILHKADEIGMAVILGYFYFGQDQNIKDEAAIVRATKNATNWILDKGYKNVLIEVDNECDVKEYEHKILMPQRVDELIKLVKSMHRGKYRLLAGTSFAGNAVPTPNVVRASDFILLHGNGISDPNMVVQKVSETRRIAGYRTMPILFNEDDHYNFDKPLNNLRAAVSAYASWGFFDFRKKGEGFDEGFQSVPVNWKISSPRKLGFFNMLKEITGK